MLARGPGDMMLLASTFGLLDLRPKDSCRPSNLLLRARSKAGDITSGLDSTRTSAAPGSIFPITTPPLASLLGTPFALGLLFFLPKDSCRPMPLPAEASPSADRPDGFASDITRCIRQVLSLRNREEGEIRSTVMIPRRRCCFFALSLPPVCVGWVETCRGRARDGWMEKSCGWWQYRNVPRRCRPRSVGDRRIMRRLTPLVRTARLPSALASHGIRAPSTLVRPRLLSTAAAVSDAGQQVRDDIRNIAIVAHVDHGKTTLVDALLQHTKAVSTTIGKDDRLMDGNDQERERGITILAKNTAVAWKDVKINIVDTPGHADFGGEVERVLNMVDGVLLIVDAAEGPKPQTRFVLKKAIAMGQKVLVVLNKIDKPQANPDMVVDKTFDLFCELGASDEQTDFNIVYTSAIRRQSGLDPQVEDGMGALLDAILELPKPVASIDQPLQMQISNVGSDQFIGRLAIGRIRSGTLKRNQAVGLSSGPGHPVRPVKTSEIFLYDGMGRASVDEASAGDIVVVAGIPEFNIGDTVVDPADPRPFEPIAIEQPTMSISMGVNKVSLPASAHRTPRAPDRRCCRSRAAAAAVSSHSTARGTHAASPLSIRPPLPASSSALKASSSWPPRVSGRICGRPVLFHEARWIRGGHLPPRRVKLRLGPGLANPARISPAQTLGMARARCMRGARAARGNARAAFRCKGLKITVTNWASSVLVLCSRFSPLCHPCILSVCSRPSRARAGSTSPRPPSARALKRRWRRTSPCGSRTGSTATRRKSSGVGCCT